MNTVMTKKLSNFIIFSNIKLFVQDLKYSYEDEITKDSEALRAYYHFINDANLLEEMEDFVQGFKRSLNGNHKAIYCEDVYLNIPEYLEREDENNKIIKKYLSKIAELYNDPSKCKEFIFFRKITENIVSEVKDKKVDLAEDEEYIKNVLSDLSPYFQQYQKEFKDKDLDLNIFIKLLLIIILEKLDYTNIFKKDTEHFKNIIKIIVNTPLQEIMTKKLDLMMEFASIKNISNINFYNILYSASSSKLNFDQL